MMGLLYSNNFQRKWLGSTLDLVPKVSFSELRLAAATSKIGLTIFVIVYERAVDS